MSARGSTASGGQPASSLANRSTVETSDMLWLLLGATASALAVLFTLGMLLAKYSRQNMLVMALKMTALGVVAILIIFLLNLA